MTTYVESPPPNPETVDELLQRPLPVNAAELVGSATKRLIEDSGKGLVLVEANLSGADLRGFDLRRAKLNRARLDGAKLDGADLSESTMICPMLERASLRGANLDNLYAHALAAVSSDWSGATMRGALDITGALFHGVDFTGADLSGGNFAGATFYQCDLTNADLRNCELSGATFNQCVMRGTRLDNALVTHVTITRCSADELVLTGATGTGLVLQSMGGLRGADLSGARLYAARIRSSALLNVTFTNAELPELDLAEAALTGCDFSGADLSQANLRAVTGERNSFIRATLTEASFVGCRLPATDFRGARAENARFLRCIMPGSLFTSIENEQGRASFTGRGISVRDSDFSNTDFTNAYLYGAFFTGDPVTGMLLDEARFTNANLSQCTVAASLRNADLQRIVSPYSRFTRSDFSGANLAGADLHQSTLVKTALTDTNLNGVAAPLFLDRCRGIESAIMDSELRSWCDDLGIVLSGRKRGAT